MTDLAVCSLTFLAMPPMVTRFSATEVPEVLLKIETALRAASEKTIRASPKGGR